MTIRDEGVMSIDSRFIPCLEMIALYSVFLFLAFQSNVSEKRSKIFKKTRLFKAALYSSEV